jgi:hypothetical protein
VRRQEPTKERLLVGNALAEPLEVSGERFEDRNLRVRSPPDRLGEPNVICVLMRREHELEILDGDADAGQTVFEGPQSRGGARPGVDQRQRIADEEPHVDGGVALERQRDPVEACH